MSQQELQDKSQYFYRASAANFMKIPSHPIAYWVHDKIAEIFTVNSLLHDVGKTRRGLQTGDSERFIRTWYEVDKKKISPFLSQDESVKSDYKWYLFNSGGSFRKWYGNIEDVVNWANNGSEIKSSGNAIIPSESLYFLEAITWPKVSSGKCSFRWFGHGIIPGDAGPCFYAEKEVLSQVLCFLNSKVALHFLEFLSPTLNFEVGVIALIPFISPDQDDIDKVFGRLIALHKADWDNYECSIGFQFNPLINVGGRELSSSYNRVVYLNSCIISEVERLEAENNDIFINAYKLKNVISYRISLKEVTLNCNPAYRYATCVNENDRISLAQSDAIKELLSYIVGCMMGRYSIDKTGLILASQGETLQDYLNQIPSPRFMPDHDAILPLTDQEWFADDVTNRVREFVKVVWGEETLQENLAFIAESLCLHAIKPLSTKNSRGESSIETIRRYLSTQFYKDHLKTYKKRPIYWLYSSGKEKAFECLVYLHRYNESTLARMRTEYVTPLMGKYDAQQSLLQEQLNDASPAQQRELEKQLKDFAKKQTELRAFDENLKHYADMRIKLDLDDGVKVNYGKFGNLLAEVKNITGDKE